MTNQDTIYRYRTLVSEGDSRKFMIFSILFHFLIIVIIFAGNILFSSNKFVVLGHKGQPGVIGVGLVDNLPAGSNFYKPPAKKIEKAATEIKRTEKHKSLGLNSFSINKKKQKMIKKTVSKQTDTSSEIGTSNKQFGIVSGKASNPKSNAGAISIGGNGKGGIYDSWYAHQVEEKIGSNWLSSRMGVQFSGYHKVVVQFDVTNEGHIKNIKILLSTGPEAFELSALRAIKASDPLPPIPFRYRMDRNLVRFVAIFEYPTH